MRLDSCPLFCLTPCSAAAVVAVVLALPLRCLAVGGLELVHCPQRYRAPDMLGLIFEIQEHSEVQLASHLQLPFSTCKCLKVQSIILGKSQVLYCYKMHCYVKTLCQSFA